MKHCRLTMGDRHGPITPCRIAHSEKLVLEYLRFEDGSSERERMEKRYGRTNVLKLVREHEEEEANRRWLEASTVACPGCEVHVEKTIGCNHVGGMVTRLECVLSTTDDVREMRATLLLSMWDEDQWTGTICSFLYGGPAVLQQAV